MIQVPVFDQAGQKVETIDVDEQKLGGSVRTHLLKQALVIYHANKRQGTVRTQARGEVAGSTRKIFRQKGTGNARMGTIRQPVRRGGGHAKQKRPKEWRQALSKKSRHLARNSAILSKIQSNDIRVVNQITLAEPKTRHVASIYKALGIERSCLFALEARNETLERSARNLDRTTLTTVEQLNCWDIMNNKTLLLTKAGLEQLLA
ncbi:MAG TPA: 50S ribosomal protein L4 [Tepidisphaeraceae bacterium]|nr:50S ribosomal protein L4 [Tepidisphaeraceae bacterium]